MSYPDLPNNRLIVDGVDLSERFGLILADGYTLSPPEPKVYTVDIPGGNGVIDLTEALNGDTVYENRKHTFTLYAIGVDDFERIKTEVTGFLHGKSFDYQLTMDPEYTYHGRFKITEYGHASYDVGVVGSFTIEVDCQPYKKKETITKAFDITGGILVNLQSGRKRVRPKFEFTEETIFTFGGKDYTSQTGTYTFNDIWFEQGANTLFLAPSSLKSTSRWEDLEQYTWKQIRVTHRIYEWYTHPEKGEVTKAVLTVDGDISGSITFTAIDELKKTHTTTFALSEEVSKEVTIITKELVYHAVDLTIDEDERIEYVENPTYRTEVEYDKPEVDDNGNPNLDRTIVSIKEYYTNDEGIEVFIGYWELEDVYTIGEEIVTVSKPLMAGDIVTFERDLAIVNRYDSDGTDIGFALPCVLPSSAYGKLTSLTCDANGTLVSSFDEVYPKHIQTKWGYYQQGGMEDTVVTGEVVENPNSDSGFSDVYETKLMNFEATWNSLVAKRWHQITTYLVDYKEPDSVYSDSSLCYVQYDWFDL